MPIVFFLSMFIAIAAVSELFFFLSFGKWFFWRFFFLSQHWPDTFVVLHTHTHYSILRVSFCCFIWRLYFSSFDYVYSAAGPNELVVLMLPTTNDAISVAHMPTDFSRRIISVWVDVLFVMSMNEHELKSAKCFRIVMFCQLFVVCFSHDDKIKTKF